MSPIVGKHLGTVAKCWIEDKKLYFEKITAWDTCEGRLTLVLHNAFVTLGYCGERPAFTKTTVQGPSGYQLSSYSCVVTDNRMFFGGYFRDFPSWVDEPKSHSLVFTGFPEDIDLDIIFLPNCYVTMRDQVGSPLQIAHISGNQLDFEYDAEATNIGAAQIHHFASLPCEIIPNNYLKYYFDY